MIRSFESARLDQIFIRNDHNYASRQLAELIWVVCQQNILEFLGNVPATRRMQITFEELTQSPEKTLEEICSFLKLDFEPAMAEPYRGDRMTTGLHSGSRMLGDVRFYEHKRVEPGVADAWRTEFDLDSLGDVTCDLARAFGYETPPRLDRAPVGFKDAAGRHAESLLAKIDLISDEQVDTFLQQYSGLGLSE
jgi:hypothetical protein